MATATSVIVGLGRWGTSQALTLRSLTSIWTRSLYTWPCVIKKAERVGLAGCSKDLKRRRQRWFFPATNADAPLSTPIALHQSWTVEVLEVGGTILAHSALGFGRSWCYNGVGRRRG